MKNLLCFITVCLSFSILLPAKARALDKEKEIALVVPASSHPRILYGAEQLTRQLEKIGYAVSLLQKDKLPKTGAYILVCKQTDDLWKQSTSSLHLQAGKTPGKEGFSIMSKGDKFLIGGLDESGALYGCLELTDRIKETGALPANISFTDSPEMVLRGACIGIQKPTLLPGRGVYEYPYTPENFPWLYDKALWLRYLDSLAYNRMNSLYLWNGHPFASLVRLKDYPYAVEVDDATFKKNEELYQFLTTEANKRGIWVIQMFYNIIVSKPFAEKHGLKTQDRNRPIIPLIADYTRKSIAAFVQKYPNVGLLVCLGEAMEGVGQDDIEWFTKTVIPGVQDGLKALGRKDEPPIVLRAHDTNAPAVMKAALPLYKNLYTEAKYNGEALTTYTPRGPWADLHRTLSRIGTVQIENIHIMANLEPFRYGSADFIQKCVQAMHGVYEANGLHLYPQASYWDWPYTADKGNKRLLQIDRDWIWYKAWSRYVWNCHRNRQEEIAYWSNMLGSKFGTNEGGGKEILNAYEESGEIAPKLLRRYGITDGNRQTLTLGMTMSQLINPYKHGLFTLLYNSEGPEGEMIIEYAEKEWKGEKHVGETPVQVAEEVIAHGAKAKSAIVKAEATVSANKEEFSRLKNDINCYDALANFYAEKVRAALQVLRYKYSNDITDLQKAVPHLEKSVAYYRTLAELTKDSYLYANSMQTSQRKIPIRGVDGTYKTWEEVLPVYQKELENLKKSIDSLKSIKATGRVQTEVRSYLPVTFSLTDSNNKTYVVEKGESVFSDTTVLIENFAKELKGLKGVQVSKGIQLAQGTSLQFETTKPVKVLVGYFTEKNALYLKEPELETDATANEYGQDEVKIRNAIVADKFPPVNIHAFSFKAGKNTLSLGKGLCMILGFIDADQPLKIYDAGLGNPAQKDIDWLFE